MVRYGLKLDKYSPENTKPYDFVLWTIFGKLMKLIREEFRHQKMCHQKRGAQSNTTYAYNI